jgi:hypothetical protein
MLSKWDLVILHKKWLQKSTYRKVVIGEKRCYNAYGIPSDVASGGFFGFT